MHAISPNNHPVTSARPNVRHMPRDNTGRLILSTGQDCDDEADDDIPASRWALPVILSSSILLWVTIGGAVRWAMT